MTKECQTGASVVQAVPPSRPAGGSKKDQAVDVNIKKTSNPMTESVIKGENMKKKEKNKFTSNFSRDNFIL